MKPRTLNACLAAALLLAVASAQAQRAPVASLTDPLDPRAEVPPATHESAFAGYRTFGDDGVGSWREANETVNRIGGWRAYAREASRPGPAEAVAPARPAPAGPAQPRSGASDRPAPGASGGAARGNSRHPMHGHGAGQESSR